MKTILLLAGLMLPVAFSGAGLPRHALGSGRRGLLRGAAAHPGTCLRETTIIIRQNPCVDSEANFIYLLIGEERALLIDTGASDDPRVTAELTALFAVSRRRGLAAATGGGAYP